MEQTLTIEKSINELMKYKDEFEGLFLSKITDLDNKTSYMKRVYDAINRELEGDTNSEYSTFINLYKQLKTSYISNTCLGYDSLFSILALNGESELLAPELRKQLKVDLRKADALFKLQTEFIDDMFQCGACVARIGMHEKQEKSSTKVKVTDDIGNEEIKLKIDILSSEDVYTIDRISPLDFLVDAEDYKRDPLGAIKIVRNYLDVPTLMSMGGIELLGEECKKEIAQKYSDVIYNTMSNTTNTAQRRIKQYTWEGDFTSCDGTVFKNIRGVLIDNKLAKLEYQIINECKYVYQPYSISKKYNREYSPLINLVRLGNLSTKTIKLNLGYLNDILNPIVLFKKKMIDFLNIKNKNYGESRQLEINDKATVEDYPKYLTPPPISSGGLDLLSSLTQNTRDTYGINDYNMGTMGSVRTASESVILNNATNRRTAVEVIPFSNFIKNLVSSFYMVKRNVALASESDSIYGNTELRVYIDNLETLTSNYDDFSKLMQLLSIPAIGTQLLANATEEQKITITRYLASKAGVTDIDSMLDLIVTPEEEVQNMIDNQIQM